MATFEGECISMMAYALAGLDVMPDSHIPESPSLSQPVLGFLGLLSSLRYRGISGRD
jgi:hypothetical protein